MIPEFAPQKAVWIQWPTSKDDEQNFIPAFVKIERECCTEGEAHNIVLDKNSKRSAKQKLFDAGVPLDNIFSTLFPMTHVGCGTTALSSSGRMTKNIS